MSTQYECLKSPDLYAEAFGIAPPDALRGKEVWPRQPAPMLATRPTER